jgi:thymidylate synthase
MVAAQTGYAPGELIWTGGDCHIYDNHHTQVREQLSRQPYPFPQLRLAPRESIFDYRYEDVEVVDYRCHPPIKAPVAV